MLSKKAFKPMFLVKTEKTAAMNSSNPTPFVDSVRLKKCA
jgi:hypothetical protein